MIHQLQCLPYPRVREEIQKRRLLKLHRQPLLERVVENLVACRVDEVCDQNSVFLSQDGRSMKIEEDCRCRDDRERCQSESGAFLASLDLADDILSARGRTYAGNRCLRGPTV